MTSRAKSLRTNAYTLSPANCSLDGTTAALREESTKNVDTTITERNTSNTGLVNHSTESEIGGRLKSLVLGGTNPAPAACKLANALLRARLEQSEEVLADLEGCAVDENCR